MSERGKITTTVLMLCVLSMFGCANTSRVTDETSEQIDAILAQSASAENVLETRRCLSTSRYQQVEILDESHLLFQGIGDRAWVNRLRHRCHGLRQSDTLLFELQGSQACSLDTVSVVDRNFFFWSRTGPVCSLGEFQQVSPDQLLEIEAVVDN